MISELLRESKAYHFGQGNHTIARYIHANSCRLLWGTGMVSEAPPTACDPHKVLRTLRSLVQLPNGPNYSGDWKLTCSDGDEIGFKNKSKWYGACGTRGWNGFPQAPYRPASEMRSAASRRGLRRG